MASTIIHMCVAKEINKHLKRESDLIILGSIAPDISKLIDESKAKSHFMDDISGIPNLKKFLNKYQDKLNDDFVLGYYIHLFTDYVWFKYFITNFVKKDYIYERDGKKISVTGKEVMEYIYSDYSNLNVKLIDEYELELKLFYDKLNVNLEPIIEEIPINRLELLINKASLLIQNSEARKAIIFDIKEINNFIYFTINALRDNLIQLHLL